MKKEATLKNAKELKQKTSDKKVATPKNAKGLKQRASDEKEATLKNAKGLIQRPPMEKEATLKSGVKKPTTHRQPANHITKSLVPHREPAEKHNNLKGVSSKSH
jgi:hypothetical protein